MTRVALLKKIDDPNQNFGIHNKTTTIGRGVECDICLDNSFVSRIHAIIERDKDRFILRDKSSNGTFVISGALPGPQPLEKKINVHGLTHGDIIIFGDKHEHYIFREFEKDNTLSKGESTQIFDTKTIIKSRHRNRFIGADIIGNCQALHKPFFLAEKAMKSETTVLITGETGTGKGLFARTIHNGSSRRSKLFVDVNCGALPSNLIESELFGHESGAYTGTQGRRIGRFELAHGGTIFLDEIGDMPNACQVKLLHVLEGRGIQRLGSSETIPIDVRIIAATKCNLKEAMKQKTFREDLYYRLNVLPIRLPPLRNRIDDIPILVRYFIKKCCEKKQEPVCTISETAMEFLKNYRYSGNIRELANIIERTVIGMDGHEIQVEDLSFLSDTWSKQNQPLSVSGSSAFLEEQAKFNLMEALKHCKGVKRHAASRLKMSPNTLYKWLKKYDLDPTKWQEW